MVGGLEFDEIRGGRREASFPHVNGGEKNTEAPEERRAGCLPQVGSGRPPQTVFRFSVL